MENIWLFLNFRIFFRNLRFSKNDYSLFTAAQFLHFKSPISIPYCSRTVKIMQTFNFICISRQGIQNLQTLLIALRLLMIILLMSHCRPLLHELFAALGVDTDAHWIAGRRSVLAEDLHHLMEQSDS